MKTFKVWRRTASGLAWVTLIGCAGWPGTKASNDSVTTPVAAATVPSTSRDAGQAQARELVADAQSLFDDQNFDGVIRLLQKSPLRWRADPVYALQALKLMAFSQCMKGMRSACRKSFAEAFAMDPSFSLQPSERGHPLWAPAFLQARRDAERQRMHDGDGVSGSGRDVTQWQKQRPGF